MYFNIFWKFWRASSYSRQCVVYWLNWYLVVETSSMTVKKPKCALRYNLWWMWRDFGTRHLHCMSEPTNCQNSPTNGSKIQNTVNTGHYSQYTTTGLVSSTAGKFCSHADIGPCGCRRGTQSHCITWLQSKMICFIIWMALCNLSLNRILPGRKTCSSPWS